MELYFLFLPALIVPVMGVNDPPAISVGVKVRIGNTEVPTSEPSGTSLSETQAFRQLKKLKNRSPIPTEYCTPFQFSNCAKEAEHESVIEFRDMRDAWQCSRLCEKTSECKSWMFRHERGDHGKCWLVKTEAGQTVKKLCMRHQGTVLPYNVVDQLDSCLEEEKLYQRRCKVGECDLLKPQYKIGEKKTKTESDCKFECEVKITIQPGNNCSNYQWDKETNQCNLFSIHENVRARAKLDELNCRIVAGTKNMTKKEVDNCLTKNFKDELMEIETKTLDEPEASSDVLIDTDIEICYNDSGETGCCKIEKLNNPPDDWEQGNVDVFKGEVLEDCQGFKIPQKSEKTIHMTPRTTNFSSWGAEYVKLILKSGKSYQCPFGWLHPNTSQKCKLE